MKRFKLIIVLLAVMIMAGCSDLEPEKSQLQSEIDTLRSIRNGLIREDDVIYVIEIEISQVHYTFDFQEHLKDSMNKISIPIQVSEEYYYSVKVGDILSDEFRSGSYIFKGSIGSWNIKVINKQTIIVTE